MEIGLNLPHVFNPGSSQVDNACALRALLDCMVALNLAYLRYHSAAPLYRSGVVYGRTKIWEPTPALYLPNKHPRQSERMQLWEPMGLSGGAKRGDCKSLACALIAEYHNQGIKDYPEFRFVKRADGSGFLDFHILVRTPAGNEDPSRKLGMGAEEINRFYR